MPMEEYVADNRSRSSQSDVDPPEFRELDLDAALARAEEARNTLMAQTTDENTSNDGLETDDDLTTDEETPADDTPDEEDEDLDEESDEANTPDTSREASSDKSQESADKSKKVTQKAKPKGTPDASSEEEEDDEPRLSRKQRGKLIEELRTELLQTEQQKKALEEQSRIQKEDDERLEKEVNRALGTEDEFNKAMEDALNGDTDAQRKAKVWKANRDFFKKLVKKAEGDVQKGFAQIYWQTVQGMSGVDPNVAAKETLPNILKHLYDAGAASVSADKDEEIAKLKDQVQTWQGRYRTLKTKSAGSTTRSPVTSGGTPVADSSRSSLSKLLNPKTGLPTDEAENLILQRGWEAVSGGRK